MNTVMKSLSTSDLAALHLKFIVPLAVGDMLHGHEKLDDVSEYELHRMIGELRPDTALLCLALCAQNIAANTDHLPAAAVLGARAEQIATEYGPLWLAHESGREDVAIDDDALADIMARIPEDLETIGDLLLATAAEMDEDNAVAAILCDILSDQAVMHAEAAEIELEQMGLLDKEPHYTGNIVTFPVRHKARDFTPA